MCKNSKIKRTYISIMVVYYQPELSNNHLLLKESDRAVKTKVL